MFTDGFHTVYAWDVVNIVFFFFFAMVVASLPAVNGVLDRGIKKVTAMRSRSYRGLLSWFQSAISTRGSLQCYDAKLFDSKPAHNLHNGLLEGKSPMSSQQHEEPTHPRPAAIELNSCPTQW